MVRGLADEVVGYNQTRGASRVMLQVGLSEFRTLPIDFTPDLTLCCRRTYADDNHRYNREEPQGDDLRPDPRYLYIELDLTVCPQLQLDGFR